MALAMMDEVRRAPRLARSSFYSALIFAALMIGHQRSASAFWNARSASGDCCASGVISMPSSSKRCFTEGSARACTVVAFSLAMISFGVSLGTQSPYQSRSEERRVGKEGGSRGARSVAQEHHQRQAE